MMSNGNDVGCPATWTVMVTNSAESPNEACLGSQQGKQAAAVPTETYLRSQQNKQTAELPTEASLSSQQ